MCAYELDEEFDFEGKHHDNSIQGVIDNIKLIEAEKVFTPRVVAEIFALRSSGPRPVGTPSKVAGFFEKWWREADVDGFNLNCKFVTRPNSNMLLIETRCVKPWEF